MGTLAEDFEYELPDDLIAQRPIEPRSAARLLVDQGSRPPEHRKVSDLVTLLEPGDLLVVNDTKVIPARLRLRRASGGAVEVLLLEEQPEGSWECLVRPARRLAPGENLNDESDRAILQMGPRNGADDASTFTVLPLVDIDDVFTIGVMPLPPYIHQTDSDPDRYQTVYARRPGSAAAPTAGLHFTVELLDSLRLRGVQIAAIELVVGLDTFRPISTPDIASHQMHTESYRVPVQAIDAISRAKRVIAVGTTAARALESWATREQTEGRTDLFITPGYQWRVVDLLMTNFHMPRTTLLVMIEALIGSRWRDLYAAAISERYRFLSFGDAMLLNRHL
ncbi:MAG: tRNA preQ1(34) S-adenosylmethionine ribosyltransferase-isomerase QueA [Ilumatobacteraceae bacterium]